MSSFVRWSFFFFSPPSALAFAGFSFFFFSFWGFSGFSGLGRSCIRAGPAMTVTRVSARAPVNSTRTPSRSSDSKKSTSRIPRMM